jgi:CMP-N,N'-diacetyllegionaminic acid synthase
MNILCVICARSGSKGIKNKNLLEFFGKPLILHTFAQAKNVKKFNHIVVSTDSKKISKMIGKKYSWFLRSRKLSGDKISKIKVIVDTLKKSEKKFQLKYDIVVDLDVTSPLRSIRDIDNAFKFFMKKNYDNLFSVCEASRNPYFNMIELIDDRVILSKKKNFISSRQTAPKVYDMNAAIYIWKRDILLKKESLFNKNTGVYIMPKHRSIDIDDKLDYKIVKFLYNEK